MCSRSVCVFVDVFIHVYVLHGGANSYFVNHLFIIITMLFVYVLQGSKGAHSSCFGSSKRFQGAGSYTNPTSSPGKRVHLQYRDNIRAHAPCSLYITPSLFPSVYPPFVLPSTFGLLSLSPPPPNPLSYSLSLPLPIQAPGRTHHVNVTDAAHHRRRLRLRKCGRPDGQTGLALPSIPLQVSTNSMPLLPHPTSVTNAKPSIPLPMIANTGTGTCSRSLNTAYGNAQL